MKKRNTIAKRTSPRKQRLSTKDTLPKTQPTTSTLKNTSPSISKSNKRKLTTPKKTKSYTHVFIHGRRFKVTSKVLKEIVKMQSSTQHLIPKLPFARLVKEIFLDAGTRGNNFKVQVATLDVLQTAAEMYITDVLEDSNLCASHCKRITLFVHDMLLAQKIRREF